MNENMPRAQFEREESEAPPVEQFQDLYCVVFRDTKRVMEIMNEWPKLSQEARNSFIRCLNRFQRICMNHGGECWLMHDFTPLSMLFQFRDGKYSESGLMYYTPGEGWDLHT